MRNFIKLPTLFAAATLFVTLPVTELNATSKEDPVVQAYIARGDELAAEGRFGSARSHYRKAVELQRAEGELPDAALRRIANTYYFQDRYQAAGHTLVELAKEAASYGDIAVEVWALADAAWIAGIEGNTQVMEHHLVKVDKLLTSPYLPDDVKQRVRARRLAGIESADRVALTP